jgi:hypothetical protein
LNSARGWGGDVVFRAGWLEDGDGEGEGIDEGGVGKIPTRGVGPAIGGESSLSRNDEMEEPGRGEDSEGTWGRAPPCASAWAVVSGVGGRREPRKLSGRGCQ